MHILRNVWPYLHRHWWRIALGLVAILTSTAFAIIQPALLGRAVDDAAGHHASITALTIDILIFLAAAAGQAISSFGQRSTVNRVSRYLEYDLRNDMFTHLQQLDQRFYGEMHTGDLMARLTNDLNQVRQFIGMGLINLVSTGIMVLGLGTAMFLVDWKLALTAFLVLPFVSITMVVIGRRMQKRFRAVQDQFGVVSTYAQENFSGIRVVKAFVQEDREIAAFADANNEYVRRQLSYVKVSGIMWPMMYFVMGVALALVVYVGGTQVADGEIKIGTFVQFQTYLGLLTWPMISLGWVINLYQQGSASMERIMEVMERQPAIADSGRTLPIETVRGKIEFCNAGVKHGDEWVFRHVSFTVEPGSTTAIVGMTGAGKTTLMSLVPRILEVDEGEVLIDGTDIRTLPLETVRRAVGYVPQDTFLFSAPLRVNVGFGVADPPEGALVDAMETSRLINDLEQFPQGLDTMVGERGVSMSGGQKQRTALARAIMRDPTILILDDAMSSVDTHTQAEILARLKQTMQGRTTLITAMRISTIKDADQIVVLDHGTVSDIGTHQELITREGLYARMYRRELLQQELEVE